MLYYTLLCDPFKAAVRGADSLAPCGLVSVEKAFLEAFGLDVAKGHRMPPHIFIRAAVFGDMTSGNQVLTR